MEEKPKLYAVYSEKQYTQAKQDQRRGERKSALIEYRRSDGTTVICTCVGDTPTAGCKWDDLQELGEVTNFVRVIE